MTQQICRVWLWFLGSVLPLIAIYLYTKFYLNANSSFKVICQTRYRTDGQMDKEATICFPPLGSIKMEITKNGMWWTKSTGSTSIYSIVLNLNTIHLLSTILSTGLIYLSWLMLGYDNCKSLSILQTLLKYIFTRNFYRYLTQSHAHLWYIKYNCYFDYTMVHSDYKSVTKHTITLHRNIVDVCTGRKIPKVRKILEVKLNSVKC